MRKLVFVLLVSMSVGLYAQTKTGGTSGIRIGGGNPYKMIEVDYFTSTSTLKIDAGDAIMTEVEIYDENDNLVGTASIADTNFSANIGGLAEGAYTIYALTEDNEVQVGTIYKP